MAVTNPGQEQRPARPLPAAEQVVPVLHMARRIVDAIEKKNAEDRKLQVSALKDEQLFVEGAQPSLAS